MAPTDLPASPARPASATGDPEPKLRGIDSTPSVPDAERAAQDALFGPDIPQGPPLNRQRSKALGEDPLWQVPPDPETPPKPAPPRLGNEINSPLRTRGIEINSPLYPNSGVTLNQAVVTADTFAGGLGGVAGTIPSPFLPKQASDKPGFRIGPISIRGGISVGVNAISQKSSGDQSSQRRSSGLNSGAAGQPPKSDSGGDFSGVFGTATLSLSGIAGDAELGRTISLQETAVFSYPSGQRGDGNSFDQTLSIAGAYLFTKLRTGFSLDLSQISGLSRDVGSNSSRTLTTVGLTSGYEWTEKTSLGLSMTLPIREFANGISSAGVTVIGTADYKYSPKSTIGLGLTGGLLKVESGEDQVFEQLTLRLGYISSEKITFSGNFGLEYRTVGSFSSLTPIFGLGATWTPTPKRSYTLSASRSVLNSAEAQSTNFTTTSLQLSGRQEIGPRLSVSASIAYENADYASVGEGGEGSRQDNFITGQISVSSQILERIMLTVGVSAGQNWSNASSLQFLQCTLQAGITF